MRNDTPVLVMVAGKDPALEPSGGHSAYVVAHARAAVEAGWHPLLVCLGPSDETRAMPYGEVHRSRTRLPGVRQLLTPFYRRSLVRSIVALAARSNGPVLVHGFGVWGVAAVDAVARLRRQGRTATAVIGSYTVYRVEHGSLVDGSVGIPLRTMFRYRIQSLWARLVVNRIERRAYRRADRVWVNYRTVADLITRTHGTGVSVETMGYSPWTTASADAPAGGADSVADLVPRDAPLVVAVARHHSRKGVDVLIDALARLAADGVGFRACIVGDGPLLETNRRRVVERGLRDAVLVTGVVPAVEPYLEAADLFVLPSRAEQSGSMALLEALRAGLPVVATDVDGIPEDVVSGRSALLAAPGDADSLATALREVLTDAALRERLAAGALARYEERFSWDGFVSSLAAAYADLGFTPD